MARIDFLFISLTFLLFALPTSFAGPACARKHYKVADCVQKCKSGWGWTGNMMGTDPWGSVVVKIDTDKNWDSVISQACGSPVLSSVPVAPSSTADSSGAPVVNPSPSATTSKGSSIMASSSPTVSSSSSFLSSVPVPNLVASDRPSSTDGNPLPTTTTRATSQARTTVVQPDPTPTPSPPPAGGSGTTSNAVIQTYLQAHNSIRSQHGAAALTWRDDLAAKAQQWANGCQFKHSGGSLGPFGENLAAGTGSYSFQSAMNAWVAEVSQYNPNSPVPSHFTQVVWKGTTQVGCAVSTCSGIFDASFGPAQYYVCEYSPQGNIIGSFPQNVQV